MRRSPRKRDLARRMASLAVCGFVIVGCVERAPGIVHSSQEEFAMDPDFDPNTIRLPRPDPEFKLTPEERASIREGFDVDALERLLAAVDTGARPIILHAFQPPAPGELEPGEFMTPPTRMGDPALQPLLDEVWATAWERFAPELLDSEEMNYPGKELAKQRRALRQRQE
jgi:hypothetical protein